MNDNVSSLIFFLFLDVLMFAIAWWQHRKRIVRLFVIFLYFLGTAGACVYCAFYNIPALFPELSFASLLFYWFMFATLICPFWQYRDEQTVSLKGINPLAFNIATSTIIALFFILMLLSGKNLIHNTIDMWQSSAWADRYMETQTRTLQKTGYSIALASFIGFLSNVFRESVFFLFFYALTLKRKMGAKIGWGFCTLCQILKIVEAAGRNGLVTASLDIVFLVLLFRRFLPKRTLRFLYVMSATLIVIMTTAIILISEARFGNRLAGGGLESMFLYLGQPILNFAYYLPNLREFSCGDNTFPLLRPLFGKPIMASYALFHLQWGDKLGIPTHIFYGITGDFVIDYGYFSTAFLFSLFSFALSIKFARLKNAIHLHDLYLIYFSFLIVGHGVFYFMQKTMSGNFIFVASILVYWWLKFVGRKDSMHEQRLDK